VYCDACLPHYQRDLHQALAATGRAAVAEQRAQGVDPSHGGAAAERRGATMTRRTRELQQWNVSHPRTIVDPAVFVREILPAIQAMLLSDLVSATGLTAGYLSQIRCGKKVPHPRHWPAFSAKLNRPLGVDP
jgi:hypothetical protein